jgi:hypothetical protein
VKFDPWTLDDGLALVRKLEPELTKAGWFVALGGSVLLKGHSDNDLDLALIPLDKSSVNHNAFRKVLTQHGFRLIWKRHEIARFWYRQNSNDTKHVETWVLGNQRVDIFVVS